MPFLRIFSTKPRRKRSKSSRSSSSSAKPDQTKDEQGVVSKARSSNSQLVGTAGQENASAFMPIPAPARQEFSTEFKDAWDAAHKDQPKVGLVEGSLNTAGIYFYRVFLYLPCNLYTRDR